MPGVFIKKGNLDTNTGEKCRVKMKAEVGVMPQTPRNASHLKLGEGLGADSLSALRRNPPCWHLHLGLPASVTARQYISVG